MDPSDWRACVAIGAVCLCRKAVVPGCHAAVIEGMNECQSPEVQLLFCLDGRWVGDGGTHSL